MADLSFQTRDNRQKNALGQHCPATCSVLTYYIGVKGHYIKFTNGQNLYKVGVITFARPLAVANVADTYCSAGQKV